MTWKQIPAKQFKALDGSPIIYWQHSDGSKSYELSDGRVVQVWPGSIICRKCGKPLTNSRSIKKGIGPCCSKQRQNTTVVLAIGDVDPMGHNVIVLK